ncbi:hypothetical protein M433DRAFT_3534 [Acidomyces richmondensis BFW]|nr:MAG: hypothetical protein FE78DRAFT_30325 [Acidomyces sp. 'richmondensis']KYG46653.1 hypothetical protein M433DRAFT_3534 [Acidomyces richmondensis BFW]
MAQGSATRTWLVRWKVGGGVNHEQRQNILLQRSAQSTPQALPHPLTLPAVCPRSAPLPMQQQRQHQTAPTAPRPPPPTTAPASTRAAASSRRPAAARGLQLGALATRWRCPMPAALSLVPPTLF